MFEIEKLVRPHILTLKPYSSARDEYTGKEGVFLDANENALGSVIEESYHRYPDPYQRAVKAKLAQIKDILPEQIFLGNGSDEAIDLLFRLLCKPEKDNVILLPPTYGMYQVSAEINQIETKQVPLLPTFQPDVERILQAVDAKTKMIFVCSPNNPTGNNIELKKIEQLLAAFHGIVVIDEAYIDFSSQPSFTQQIGKYPNLVVLQTFSKAWGLAGLRMGMAFAQESIIQLINKIKPPYNLNQVAQSLVLQGLENEERKNQMVQTILEEREKLEKSLQSMNTVQKIYPSDSNFLLIKVEDANKLYDFLIHRQVIVRNRSNVMLCENALRITVGTQEENEALLEAMNLFMNKQ